MEQRKLVGQWVRAFATARIMDISPEAWRTLEYFQAGVRCELICILKSSPCLSDTWLPL